VLGQEETSQIKSYAFAITEDERFRDVPTRWTFWLLGNDLNEYVRNETSVASLPPGVLWESSDRKVRIWVKRWSQVLNESRTRLSVFQRELDYIADREESLQYLKDTYARILEGSTDSESDDDELNEFESTATDQAFEA
jgi:hypothetical protein